MREHGLIRRTTWSDKWPSYGHPCRSYAAVRAQFGVRKGRDRTAVNADESEQRGLKPAAVLVRSFEVQVSAPGGGDGVRVGGGGVGCGVGAGGVDSGWL